VLKAVKQNGDALQYATGGLRGDWDVVLQAVGRTSEALRHAPPAFSEDRGFLLEAVAKNFRVMYVIKPWLQAMECNGLALQFAAPQLRDDSRVVLRAVEQNGHALQFASPQLRADREVVLAAVAERGHALQHAPIELRGNPSVVLEALARNGCALQHASDPLRADVAMVLLSTVKPQGPTGQAVPHVQPAWAPLDREPFSALALEALAAKWEIYPSSFIKDARGQTGGCGELLDCLPAHYPEFAHGQREL